MSKSQGLSESLEDYLETIHMLATVHTVARSRDIAARLNVNRSSVTGALQALAERGLVNYEPYGYVTLTSDGETIAKKVLYRHRVLRDFMIKVLAVDATLADDTACRMEHAVPKPVIERLVAFAEYVEAHHGEGTEWIRDFGGKQADSSPSR